MINIVFIVVILDADELMANNIKTKRRQDWQGFKKTMNRLTKIINKWKNYNNKYNKYKIIIIIIIIIFLVLLYSFFHPSFIISSISLILYM